MINRILIELYDEYEKNNIDAITEFSKKTFPNDGTDKFFLGCTLIMFSRANSFKPRYDCNREELLAIVSSFKEKTKDSNLLDFYLDRINTTKGIRKIFNKLFEDENVEKYADTVIDYLEQFKPKFIKNTYNAYKNKIEDKE